MTNTHAKRIAFHLEGLLEKIDLNNPKPIADALTDAVATAYHTADTQHDQRVAFALAMLAAASAALSQVEAEAGGLVDEVIAAKGRGIDRLLDIRKAAEDADIACRLAGQSLAKAAK